MKTTLVVLLVVAALAVAVGVDWPHESWKISGGGDAMREERMLPPFNRVAIDGFADLILVQGDSESISIEGPPKHLHGLLIEVTDGTLLIANPETRHWWLDFLGGGARPVRATLTYRTLNAISVEGAAKLRAGRLQTDRLHVSASGATSLQITALDAKELAVNGSGAIKMELAERSVAQRIRISGAGNYRAAKLDSETAQVTVSGAGRVSLRAEKTLDIDISGAGAVDYFGNPRVTKDVSGIGRVKRRAAE